MSTQLEICNIALGWLGASPIAAMDEESNEARLCSASYDLVYNACLEERAWTFNTEWVQLLADSQAPANPKYARRYPLPPGVLRILECSRGAAVPDRNLDWVKERHYVLANGMADADAEDGAYAPSAIEPHGADADDLVWSVSGTMTSPAAHRVCIFFERGTQYYAGSPPTAYNHFNISLVVDGVRSTLELEDNGFELISGTPLDLGDLDEALDGLQLSLEPMEEPQGDIYAMSWSFDLGDPDNDAPSGVLYARVLVDSEDVDVANLPPSQGGGSHTFYPPPTFEQAVAARLAAVLAVPLTQSQATFDKYWALYERLIRSAAALDGQQGRSERVYSSRLADARRR